MVIRKTGGKYVLYSKKKERRTGRRRPQRTSSRGQPACGTYNGAVNDLLPGHDLIEEGLADLERDRNSVPALLVSIGAPRLRRLGLRIPRTISTPEHRLYELLARDDPDAAHGRYNALIRRLVSFERAAECAR